MRISDWSSDVCSSDLLAIQSGSAAFVRAARRMPELESAAWRDATAAAHADFLAYNQPTEIPGRLQLGKVVAWLNETLPPEAIMTNGAGNYATWLHRFYRFRRYRSQLEIGRASCRERGCQYV